MKSKKRKELEMEALLLDFTVTYSARRPAQSKIGDRWYDTVMGRYHVATKKPPEYARLLHGMTDWLTVGSKKFFDTSDIQ